MNYVWATGGKMKSKIISRILALAAKPEERIKINQNRKVYR